MSLESRIFSVIFLDSSEFPSFVNSVLVLLDQTLYCRIFTN